MAGGDGIDRKMYLAMFDYDPDKLSPNPDAHIELSFKQGDIITVFGKVDEDGFFQVKKIISENKIK